MWLCGTKGEYLVIPHDGMCMKKRNELTLKRLGIDTYKEAVIYMRADSPVCIAEGFEVKTRVRVALDGRFIIATINMISTDLLTHDQASLSEYAWNLLGVREGEQVTVSHAKHPQSLSLVRSKMYGNPLSEQDFSAIIQDIARGYYSDVHISSFLTACATGRLSTDEIVGLSRAMVAAGQQLRWDADIVVDKHSVGGLPGNRTTPIVVPLVAAFGLTIPKTSSRAITSPAGTADTMEVLAPVELTLEQMRGVVQKERGCIVWGGAVALSPADDILIRVKKSLDIDSEGQLIASILSKKIAAGSTHVIIDIPVGPTAKFRSQESAQHLKNNLVTVGKQLGLVVEPIITDGTQPVGNGIGPALEARDVLAVLRNEPDAPQDLRERALLLAGTILEFSPDVKMGEGYRKAEELLESGQAFKKFEAICSAQGGMRTVPISKHMYPVATKKQGEVIQIDNRRLARCAKLAGAPIDKGAGVDLQAHCGATVRTGDVLFMLHADSEGELAYAKQYLEQEPDIFTIKE